MTTHDAVVEALADPRVQKDKRHWRAFAAGEIPPDWPLISWIVNDNMLAKDGEDHTRLRRLVSKAFTPRRVERLRPAVVDIVERLLDDVEREAAASEDGVVDLKRSFAEPLPLTVIGDLFGLSEEDRPRMHRLVNAFFDQGVAPEEAFAIFGELWELLTVLVETKRAVPGDDLTTALITARDEDDALTENELIWNLVLFISAGHETTMNLIVNAVSMLDSHRDQLALVREGGISWDRAIEETLRFAGPAAYLPMRYTAEDMELAGIHLPKGEPLLLGYTSAGKDPERYGPTAGEFDVTREDTSHLSFSRGRHFCLGAGLARLEAREALPRLFERFPGLRVAPSTGAPAPMTSFIIDGLETLPVRPRP
ncbi:cytochrome P450 family protein [Nocardiopsis alba]|uniref:cytochrome P450 family protein n=1 Tax=Nocardiopsis alba TaxID=53437 RepID=UPI0003481854|nr:cytochrome P450 [Nocardiopsis alba]